MPRTLLCEASDCMSARELEALYATGSQPNVTTSQCGLDRRVIKVYNSNDATGCHVARSCDSAELARVHVRHADSWRPLHACRACESGWRGCGQGPAVHHQGHQGMPQPPGCQSRRPSAGGGIHRRQPPAGLGRLGPQRDYAHLIARRVWKFTMSMVLQPTMSKSWKGFTER